LRRRALLRYVVVRRPLRSAIQPAAEPERWRREARAPSHGTRRRIRHTSAARTRRGGTRLRDGAWRGSSLAPVVATGADYFCAGFPEVAEPGTPLEGHPTWRPRWRGLRGCSCLACRSRTRGGHPRGISSLPAPKDQAARPAPVGRGTNARGWRWARRGSAMTARDPAPCRISAAHYGGGGRLGVRE